MRQKFYAESSYLELKSFQEGRVPCKSDCAEIVQSLSVPSSHRQNISVISRCLRCARGSNSYEYIKDSHAVLACVHDLSSKTVAAAHPLPLRSSLAECFLPDHPLGGLSYLQQSRDLAA